MHISPVRLQRSESRLARFLFGGSLFIEFAISFRAFVELCEHIEVFTRDVKSEAETDLSLSRSQENTVSIAPQTLTFPSSLKMSMVVNCQLQHHLRPSIDCLTS